MIARILSIKYLIAGLSFTVLSVIYSDLYGQRPAQTIGPVIKENKELKSGSKIESGHAEIGGIQKGIFVSGRITQINSVTPVFFALITSDGKSPSLAKSDSEGRFKIVLSEIPAIIRIRKIGYNEETVRVQNPADSLLISMTPVEIRKNFPGNKKTLQYDLIFKRAVEKLNISMKTESSDDYQRELVYTRITSSSDSGIINYFESYAHMNVGQCALRDIQTDIARYATTGSKIPGLSGNTLGFDIKPFIRLPIFPEKYISKRGCFLQGDSKVIIVKYEADKSSRTYFYIDLSDTSVIYLSSLWGPVRKSMIYGSDKVWQQGRTTLTEVSFKKSSESRSDNQIDCISQTEKFSLFSKDKPGIMISRNKFYAVVPKDSPICNEVSNQLVKESLSGTKQQLNYKSKFMLSGKSTDFISETDKLLLQPYNHDFWTNNSFILPDDNRQKQIDDLEITGRFYSEKGDVKGNPVAGADSLANIMNKNLIAVENVYIETDRSSYVPGDTIWFSAFVVDNLKMDSTSLSKILYVDLINPENKLEKHLKLLIRNGRSRGDFTIAKEMKNGICRLRAYTQYMRNFQEEYLFEKEIPVQQTNFNKYIIVNPFINNTAEGDSVELHIQTAIPGAYKRQMKKLEVIAKLNDTLSVRKTFSFKQDLNSSMGFFVSSSLHCSSIDIRLILSDMTIVSEKRLSLELKSGVNIRFYPESGKIVEGMPAVIAFRAIDNIGRPVSFDADIIDEDQNRVAHISGDNTGIGKFEFKPEYNHTYKALMSQSGGKYIYDLPVTEPKGYVINFNPGQEELLIRNNINASKHTHFLLVSERGYVYSSTELKLDTSVLQVHLPLEMYSKGIVQVTLLDSLLRPLAERLVFNNRDDEKMLIHIVSDKKEYGRRDKVSLNITVTDIKGNPVRASLSAAVVNALENDTTIVTPDIESYLYLTSELKGSIYYSLLNLSDTTASGRYNTDLVMMTQGWRNYLWNSIRYTNTLKGTYPIEKGFTIDGSLMDYGKNRSLNGYDLDYLNFNSGFNGIVKVNENNRFELEVPLFYGSDVFMIQNRNRRGRIEKLYLSLDTATFPEIRYRKNDLPYSRFREKINNILREPINDKDSAEMPERKYINLAEVSVTAKSRHPWYSVPDATIDLNKKDATGKKYSSLFQLIYEEFGEKAFTAIGFNAHSHAYNPLLVVDGTPLTASNCPPCYDLDMYRWATNLPVNEISDIKFYQAGSKFSQWLTPPQRPGAPSPKELFSPLVNLNYLPIVAFNTYSNSYRGNPKGAVVFPFQGIYQAREFYEPDYEHNIVKAPDRRTTIYWNPAVETDSAGHATVSFYNSDLNGKALIRISGVSFELKDASSVTAGYLSH